MCRSRASAAIYNADTRACFFCGSESPYYRVPAQPRYADLTDCIRTSSLHKSGGPALRGEFSPYLTRPAVRTLYLRIDATYLPLQATYLPTQATRSDFYSHESGPAL